MMTAFQKKIRECFPALRVLENEPMAKHTSFRIGGPAEVMAFPKNVEELVELLQISHEWGIKPVVIGAGTNLLAPDEGLSGLIICTKDALDGMEQLDETHIRVMAGVTMARAAMFAASLGLSGLEFAHGIPGTVGGGAVMNAGAYGGEISQVAVRTEFVTMDGRLKSLAGNEQNFSYRHSAFSNLDCVITAVEFALTPAPEEEIREKIKELMARRRASQPLDLPSAGSTFKRPATGYAAALIEQTGLKGLAVGGAAVSTKHAGFVVNQGGATAADVQGLIAQVQQKVQESTGVLLEPEVIRL